MLKIMLKKWKTIVTIILILTKITASFGQELNGLSYNHAITKAISEGDKGYLKSSLRPISFNTEFFEDFSSYYYSVFPRNDHFTDRYAFINSAYPDSMISMGVATLDAYNEKGYPYYSLASGKVVPSDSLTSQPFNFAALPSGKVYFSFFYEPGGKGDPPEGIINDIPDVLGEDSLILEFYSVQDTLWKRAYYTLDNSDTHKFKQVVVRVDSILLQDGFRFRFRNYTSMPSNYQEGQDLGMFSNADQWHIDYIQMRVADSASMYILRDITVAKALLPSLKEYTSVPWQHYTLAQSSTGGVRGNIPFLVRNFDPNYGNSVHFHRHFKVVNLTREETTSERDMENSQAPFESLEYQDNFSTGINYIEEDSLARIEITGYIEPDVEVIQPLVNDTVKRIEVYYDHYAYDDGTAEFGFGINGESEEFARFAQHYRVFHRGDTPDSLHAILIYFSKSMDSATLNYTYSVSIRNDNGSIPSSENLFTSDTLSPDYSSRLNEFTRIEIDPPIPVSESFYVVINQIDGYLNIGYDINNDNLNKILVYTNQVWTNPYTMKPGSLMIRPSFGKYTLPTEIEEKPLNAEKFSIYPNPASDFLNFNFSENSPGVHEVQIFNIMGARLIHSTTDDRSIPVSSLNPGVYFVVITSPDSNFRQTAKFIKE
jgi:hypothetical protein